MSIRQGSQATAWAHAQMQHPSQNWVNQCLKFVRSCFDVPAKYHDAAQAWNRAVYKHPSDRRPPVGVPVFWTGGRKGYGHAALSAGDGWIYSTDIKRRGKVDYVRLSLVEEDWDLTYQGWSEDVNGVRVYTPSSRREWYVFDHKKPIVVAYGPALDGHEYTLGFREVHK